jgi:hypothetical protein
MAKNTTKTPAVKDGLGPPSLEWAALPRAVVRLRGRILQSVAAGEIDDLLIPIQWSEVPPLFMRSQPQNLDPIAYLKARSFDGEGHEMLRILGAVLSQAYAVQVLGGITTYLWPLFPIVPEREPRATQRLEPWRCVRFADLTRRGSDGGLLVHRISIGSDGTWHYFWTDA